MKTSKRDKAKKTKSSYFRQPKIDWQKVEQLQQQSGALLKRFSEAGR